MSSKVIHTDEMLLSLMATDDQTAFTAIYQRYWERLFITAVKALRSKDDAADVVQDVFYSLWKRRREIVINNNLEAYLQTSVRYKAIHYIEKNITRRDYLALFAGTAVSTMPTVEGQLQLKEVQTAIQSAIEKMPPKMREVYQLSRYHHLSHKEIAERLGISDETVKKHIQHALQLIRTTLGYSSGSLVILLLSLHS